MKAILFILVLVVAISCKKDDEKVVRDAPNETITDGKFTMYEMSEMATLMEQMYIDNERLKERLEKGDIIGKFPNHFLKIHTAAMTDDKENDAFFKEQAALFINAQKMIYEDPKNAKTHFNNGVDACLKCHEVKCGGPIPRIKKLYIN